LSTPSSPLVTSIGAATVCEREPLGPFTATVRLHALASYGLLGAEGRAGLRSLDTTVLGDVLRHAVASAAVTVARAGALPPDREELDAALAGGSVPER
ncbi:carbohydrate kinase, partial [Streptomyces sp. NPDC053705]